MPRSSRDRWPMVDAIPAHVRRLSPGSEIASIGPGKTSSPTNSGSLFAACEHPLQAQANTQHRLLVLIALASQRPSPERHSRGQRRSEVADAGNDQLLGLSTVSGSLVTMHSRPEVSDAFTPKPGFLRRNRRWQSQQALSCWAACGRAGGLWNRPRATPAQTL